MIFQDKDGFPVEEHLDGGDSSMRAGMGLLTGLFSANSFKVNAYSPWWGWATRHPTQEPWNNPLNFTRDQLIPLVAGLNSIGRHDLIRKLALWHILRLGFCQDFQSNAPGTWKYPWPTAAGPANFADPTLPNDWWTMIKGGKLYPLYILFPICLMFALLATYLASEHQEQNQMIAELSFYPKWLTKLYVKWNPEWDTNNFAYWQSRNEGEYSTAIETFVKNRLT